MLEERRGSQVNQVVYRPGDTQRREVGERQASQIDERRVSDDARIRAEYAHGNPAEGNIDEHDLRYLVRVLLRGISAMEQPVGDEA